MTRLPFVLDKTFPDDLREELIAAVDNIVARGQYDDHAAFGRVTSNHDSLRPFMDYLLPAIREIAGDDKLLPSYLCWARYAGLNANLPAHKDDNACTFTIDYCLRQRSPWGIFVEGVEYVLQENQSLVFMGEEQEHWRGPFPPANMVEMIFFHYVPSDHWFFDDTKERPERFRL